MVSAMYPPLMVLLALCLCSPVAGAEEKALLPKGIPAGYKLVYSQDFDGNGWFFMFFVLSREDLTSVVPLFGATFDTGIAACMQDLAQSVPKIRSPIG